MKQPAFCFFITVCCLATGAQSLFIAPELLSRPTDTSVSVSFAADSAVECFLEFGTITGNDTQQTAIVSIAARQPVSITIPGLLPDTGYFYRLMCRIPPDTGWHPREHHTFHTQRKPGSTFTFAVASDAHINTSDLGDTALLACTIQNIASGNPDFYIDLGDMFSNENSDAAIFANNVRMRSILAPVSVNTPVFLALGNHENEEGWFLSGATPLLPVQSTNLRKLFFPNPVPDWFYTGDTTSYTTIGIVGDGLRESFYAFDWGDALFVVLDPFWSTIRKPHDYTVGFDPDNGEQGDRWDWTLGIEQYTWLNATLSGSSQPYKFVFSHQMTGGVTAYGRGGALAVDAGFEWGGGENAELPGSEWQQHRPMEKGWRYGPVHQILVRNKVNVFFHGHDHCYVREVRDGMVYQEMPQPDNPKYSTGFWDPSLYASDAEVVTNSGHLEVTVTPDSAIVAYIKSFPQEKGGNGTIAARYTILPATPVQQPPRHSIHPPHSKRVAVCMAQRGKITFSARQSVPAARSVSIYSPQGKLVVRQSPGHHSAGIDLCRYGIRGTGMYVIVWQ